MEVFISADTGVAGDAAVCAEAERFPGGVQTVAVKDGIGKFSANCLHPQVAQVQIYG
jgi:D-amino peptidase